MRYLVGMRREIMSWLNMKEFGDLLNEFSSIEAAQEYISRKPKFLRKKLHIVEK